jgi:hypothetical protein
MGLRVLCVRDSAPLTASDARTRHLFHFRISRGATPFAASSEAALQHRESLFRHHYACIIDGFIVCSFLPIENTATGKTRIVAIPRLL